MNATQTYDAACFSLLIYEFGKNDENMTNIRISRQLSRLKLGELDLGRVQGLRNLKNELQVEISKHQSSEYYLGPHGKYADVADFDIEKIRSHYSQRYPDFSKEMIGFVGLAIYAYYVR